MNAGDPGKAGCRVCGAPLVPATLKFKAILVNDEACRPITLMQFSDRPRQASPMDKPASAG
jgi:hypothetical protein